jgi:hypothetical protein
VISDAGDDCGGSANRGPLVWGVSGVSLPLVTMRRLRV